MAKTNSKPAKHVPQRTCIACRETNEKRNLIRIVRTADGVVADSSGKVPGRGAYVHESRECWEKALSRGILARSLKTEITAENLEKLRADLEERTPASAE